MTLAAEDITQNQFIKLGNVPSVSFYVLHHAAPFHISLPHHAAPYHTVPIHATCVARPTDPYHAPPFQIFKTPLDAVASIVSQPHAAPNAVDALSLRSMLQKYMHLQISTIELASHRLHSMPPLFVHVTLARYHAPDPCQEKEETPLTQM